MKQTNSSFEILLPSLELAFNALSGGERRRFAAQVSLDLGKGSQVFVCKRLGISRETLRKGVKELETGIYEEDKFKERGRKPLELKQPELLASIKEIVDGASQTDPKFTSTRLYTRLSSQEVRNQLIKRGYKDEDLPSNQTIWNKMHSLGYKRRKVSKTKPKKK